MKYSVIKTKRKTISLQITEEHEVIVRAPLRLSGREIERFVLAHEKWVEKSLDNMRRFSESHPEPSAEEKKEMVIRARKELTDRVEYYAEIMGLRPSGIKITGAKQRFGSCSAKNGLCFSWRLMNYPAAAIDYVIVHELAHIVHKNHGARFYTLIESVMPDYKARRALLKR